MAEVQTILRTEWETVLDQCWNPGKGSSTTNVADVDRYEHRKQTSAFPFSFSFHVCSIRRVCVWMCMYACMHMAVYSCFEVQLVSVPTEGRIGPMLVKMSVTGLLLVQTNRYNSEFNGNQWSGFWDETNAIHVMSIMPFMQQNMRRNGSNIFCKLKATVRPALYEFFFS
jgi:hypothetical protein